MDKINLQKVVYVKSHDKSRSISVYFLEEIRPLKILGITIRKGRKEGFYRYEPMIGYRQADTTRFIIENKVAYYKPYVFIKMINGSKEIEFNSLAKADKFIEDNFNSPNFINV